LLILVATYYWLLSSQTILTAVIQYRRWMNQIKQDEFVYSAPLPLSEVVAVLLLLIGLFGLIHILL
jgi:hypothetical protein